MSSNQTGKEKEKSAGKAPAVYTDKDAIQDENSVNSKGNNNAGDLHDTTSFTRRLERSTQSMWQSTMGGTSAGGKQIPGSLADYRQTADNKPSLPGGRQQGPQHVLSSEHIDWKDRQSISGGPSASTSSFNGSSTVSHTNGLWREQTASTPGHVAAVSADWQQWQNNEYNVPITSIESQQHLLMEIEAPFNKGNTNSPLDPIGFINNEIDDGADVRAFLQQPYYTDHVMVEGIQEEMGPPSTLIHMDQGDEIGGLPVSWIKSFRQRWVEQSSSPSSSYLSPAERYLTQLLESTTTNSLQQSTPIDIVAYLDGHHYTDDVYNDDILPPEIKQGEQALRQLLLDLQRSDIEQAQKRNETIDAQSEARRQQAINRLQQLRQHLMNTTIKHSNSSKDI
ncbi:hypothetical protein BDF19DRAFT_456365 [Syncephalis fuscata]|nr:hypothetical protein BDF19DRAFT_456365 [Syncephalis fuscata]